MMRYIILNLIVLAAISLLIFATHRRLLTRRWLVTLLVLLLMTAVFDSVIVGTKIVAYNPAHYLGVSIGRAPLEDFAYTIAALLVVPYIWNRLGEK